MAKLEKATAFEHLQKQMWWKFDLDVFHNQQVKWSLLENHRNGLR
jgi:hypothetical protein